MLHIIIIVQQLWFLLFTVVLQASTNILLSSGASQWVSLCLVGEVDRDATMLICFCHMSLIVNAHLLVIYLRKQLRIVWLGWWHNVWPCWGLPLQIRCESLLSKHRRLSSLVLIRKQVQPAGALLKFEDAPRELWEVSLRVGSEYTKRAQKMRDLNLPLQLVEASLE